MRFEKTVTLNLGNYESLKIGVSDYDSFQDCDIALYGEIRRLGLADKMDLGVRKSLGLV